MLSLSPEIFQIVTDKFRENAFGSIYVASFTPIPFKVFTIAGGVAKISMPALLLGAVLGRGMRFFLVGGLLYCYGAPITLFIEKYLERLVVAFTILLFGGFYFFKFVF